MLLFLCCDSNICVFASCKPPIPCLQIPFGAFVQSVLPYYLYYIAVGGGAWSSYQACGSSHHHQLPRAPSSSSCAWLQDQHQLCKEIAGEGSCEPSAINTPAANGRADRLDLHKHCCMRYNNRKWARRDPLKGAPEETTLTGLRAAHTGFTEDSAVWAGPTCRQLWVT